MSKCATTTLFPAAYLKLFACCIAVKGATRSIICDTQRDKYHFIPNDLYNILLECDEKKMLEILQGYNPSDQEVLLGYIDFLITNELAFFTDSPELFPAIDETFDTPELINNAIIDINNDSHYNLQKAIRELDKLGCSSLQFRFFGSFDVAALQNVTALLADTSFHTVEMLVAVSPQLKPEDLEALLQQERRLSAIYAFGAPEDRVLDIKANVMKKLFLFTQKLNGPEGCGCISPIYFTVSLSHILESKWKNNCLNKKVSIDAEGLIRNCPSRKESFGHINNTSLLMTIKMDHFQRLWSIHKDKVAVCKDCEFRYICSDCRTYTTSDEYSKPSKCNYDPYSARWN